MKITLQKYRKYLVPGALALGVIGIATLQTMHEVRLTGDLVGVCGMKQPITCRITQSMQNKDFKAMERPNFGCEKSRARFLLIPPPNTSNSLVGTITRSGTCASFPDPGLISFSTSTVTTATNTKGKFVKKILDFFPASSFPNLDRSVIFPGEISWASNPIKTIPSIPGSPVAFVTLGGVGSLYSCTVPSNATCIEPVCGNSITETNEECDDGNQLATDSCNNCKLSVCRNGIQEGTEQCDDGNQIDADSCTNSCIIPVCRNGVKEGAEQCDDGNQIDTDACSNSCNTPICGDSILNQASEQCDDGNQIATDSCNNCKLPVCRNGVQEGTEQCDDGNQIDTDACSNACKTPVCGNGTVEHGESCDDNNVAIGDGCSSTCTVEPHFTCTMANPSVCTDDVSSRLSISDFRPVSGSSVTAESLSIGFVFGDGVRLSWKYTDTRAGARDDFLYTQVEITDASGEPEIPHFSRPIEDFNGFLDDSDYGTTIYWRIRPVFSGQNGEEVFGTFSPIQSFIPLRRSEFAAQVGYATGDYPNSIAVGDLNGDGKADIAVANQGNSSVVSTVSVLLSNNNGTFEPKVDYPTGNNPRSVAIGDLNGDGKADLAVTNQGLVSATGGTVSVLLNNGNGTFAVKKDYQAGSGPWSVAIGDLNGDGKEDLAVGGQNSYVSIYLNNNNITFQPKVDYLVEGGAQSLKIGDLNNDGRADLAMASIRSLSVMLNNGNGNFSKTYYTLGSNYTSSVAIGDLNGDGKLDIAITNALGNHNGIVINSFLVSIFLNNGNGTFATKVDYPTGISPSSVAIGDLNGDTKLDLAIASLGNNSFSVFLNNGNGTFPTKVNYPIGSGVDSITIADLNGDGKMDIAVVGQGNATLFVLLHN